MQYRRLQLVDDADVNRDMPVEVPLARIGMFEVQNTELLAAFEQSSSLRVEIASYCLLERFGCIELGQRQPGRRSWELLFAWSGAEHHNSVAECSKYQDVLEADCQRSGKVTSPSSGKVTTYLSRCRS